jgi:dual specificity phosphatase 12
MHSHLHDEETEASEIISNVWISGVEPLCTDFMEQIDSVLTLLPENRFDEEILQSLLKNKITHRIKIEDQPTAPIEEHFISSAIWINKQREHNRRVLIHCAKGKSRSTTILMSYMMQYPNPDDLLFMIRKVRPVVNPNEGFMEKLRQLSLRLHVKTP